MKTTILTLIALTYFVLIPSFSKAQNEGVEVVVATGIDFSQSSAMSPNNRFCAMGVYNTISIWDVNTGRMLRTVPMSNNMAEIADSIWFSDDNSKVVCSITASNNSYEIDVATGKSTFVEGPPMDWTTYKYQQPIRQQSSLWMFQGKGKVLKYKSPNGKATLHYKKIPNPLFESSLMPHLLEARIEVNGKLSEPLDTVTQANFAWSPDGDYAFVEHSIIDLNSGRVVSKLKIVPFSGMSVGFMPGTRTPVTAGIQTIRIWDFPDIEEIPMKDISQFKLSENGKHAIVERYVVGKSQRYLVRYDMLKRKKEGKIFKSKETGYMIDVSNDGTRAAMAESIQPNPGSTTVKFNVKVCDFETGDEWNIPNTTKALFTLDKDVVIVDSIGNNNQYYNLKTKERRPFVTAEDSISKTGYFVADGDKYMLGYTIVAQEDLSQIAEIHVWDINTGETKIKVKSKGIYFSGIAVSKDEKYVAIATDYEYAIKVFDFSTGALVHKLKGHTSAIDKIAFSSDNKRLLSSSLDGTRRLWNLEKGKEMASLVNTGKKDYAIITPEQYYFATKEAKKMIHFVKGDKIYPFSQFDLKYNRPDIIIKSLEASNQGLIKPFYYAYQKRLKRLGFTEDMLDGTFQMPTAEISNRSEIPIATNKDKLTLNISGQDQSFNLDRILVRVNEVPLKGKNGISIKDKGSKEYNGEVELELSYGKNLIEVSVLNEKGVESIASNITVDYNPDEITKPNLYMYTIGVSEYRQSDFNLTYAAKDAGDIQALYASHPVPYNKIIAKELTDAEVTLESIAKIKEDLMETNVDDAVCVFFAGHGVLDVELNYFLASYDMDFQNPGERGIPYEVLEDLLDDIPARKKLIMIDACHSGEIDKDEVALIESENTTESDGDIAFRAITSTSLKQVGLTNSFELMRELFNDVKKSSGTVIISSAGGMEYAMEGGEWNNGVFTYCFLNGIKNKEADLDKDGKIYLSEVNTYVREKVFNLTNGKQQPTNRAEVFEQDWRLW